MKLKVPNSKFTGISHGLKFTDGLSEDCKSAELISRMVAKGYEEVECETPISKMKLDDLKIKAQELDVQIPEGAKVEDIRTLIKEKLEADGQ